MSELELTLDPSTVGLIQKAYAAFNARDVDAALACMQPDVEWPNGMEGGTVHYHGGVRAYWTRQWGVVNPHVDPVKIDVDHHGRVVVEAHQVVRDLPAATLLDRTASHIYALACALIP